MKTVYLLLVVLLLAGCVQSPMKKSGEGGEQTGGTRFTDLKGLDPEHNPGDAIPVEIYREPLVYPIDLKARGIKGEATVEFVVNSDGMVERPSIVSQTNPAFGYAAMACVLKWRFKPGTHDGKPVNCAMVVPFIFDVQ